MAKLLFLVIIFFIGSGVLVWQYFMVIPEEKVASVKEEIRVMEEEMIEEEIKTTEEKIEEEDCRQIIEKEKTELFFKTDWQWLAMQEKLYQLNSVEINLILEQLWERFPIMTERLKALSILGLGAPYQLGPLGEEIGKDKDPVFRLDKFDCTTFILTKTALLHSRNLEQAREMIKFLNYGLKENPLTGEKEPKITFENRLHFTSFRNRVSPYFRDITEQIAGSKRIREKKITLNKIKPDGQRLIDIDWEKEIVLKYIPNKYINKKLLQELPMAVGVAFIRDGDEKIGLDVRHEGLLFNGNLFFHASSKRGEVVVDNFLEWYFDQNNIPRFQGIIFFDPAIETKEKDKTEKLNEIYPRFLAMEVCQGISQVKTSEKIVAFTFDDGPNKEYTREILSILENYNIKATFFINGIWAKRDSELVKEIFEKGHIIANHGFSHQNFIHLSEQEIKEEIIKTSDIIYEIIGKRPTFFRPPFGACSSLMVEILREKNYQIITWSAMTNDWDPVTAEYIAQDILRRVGPGGIIGLHDGWMGANRSQTVKAVPKIIRELQDRGYRFVSLSDLLNIPAYR